MTSVLQQLFRLEPGEGPKIARFALLGLLLQAGLAMGTSAADSLFLVNVGATKLPHIYILTPVMMLLYIPAYSALLARWGMDRVFDCTLGVLIAGGVTLWLTFGHYAGAEPLVLCYVVKLYAALWYVGLYTLFWNFLDGYFDLVNAKRLFSLFAAGSATGAIVGGSLVALISARFGVHTLFLGWAVCAALAWPVALFTRRRTPRLEADEPGESDAPALAQAVAAGRQIVRSRYALVLTAVLFLTLINATVCEYQYMGIFSDGIEEATLAALFGKLTAMVNVVNLAVSLFFFNKLVVRFGVRNVALIQPVAYAVVFTWLLLDGGFPAAIAGFFAYQGIMTAIDFNNVNLMFAGLPASGRKQIRTVIEGLCEPLATATGGFFLLLLAPRLSAEQLSVAGIVVAFACLALVFVLRVDYVAAITANLRRDWLDFSSTAEPLLRSAGPADLDLAEARTHDPDPDTAALALRVLWLNEPPRAVLALLAFLRQATPAARARLQPLVDEILAKSSTLAAQEVQRWLDDEQAAIAGEFADDAGEPALAAASPGGRATPPEARAAAAVALWRSWRVGDGRDALRRIEDLFAANDEASLLAGLRALGRLGEGRYAYLLRDYLRSPSPAIRGEALHALSLLANRSSRVLMPELLATLRAGSGEERRLALLAYERIGDSGALGTLLATAGTFTPAERRQTEQMVERLGPRSVPTLITIAQSPGYTVTARSVALRALGKLALPQLQSLAGPLIDHTARKAYVVLANSIALAGGPDSDAGRAVLHRIYCDYPRLVLEIILETLTVAGRLHSYEAVLAGLNSAESKERGYAIESVEQACDRETFLLLQPLVDGRSLEAQVAFGRAHGLIQVPSLAQVLERALASEFPLEAAAAAQALYAADAAGAAGPALTKVRTMARPLLRETVLTLFARAAGRHPRADEITPVEGVRALMESHEFAGALFTHLEFMAPHIRRTTPAAGTVLGRRGEPLPGAWLVRQGAIAVEGAAPHGPGTMAGRDTLRGDHPAPATLTAGPGLDALFLPARVVRRCIETYPELGLVLLRNEVLA